MVLKRGGLTQQNFAQCFFKITKSRFFPALRRQTIVQPLLFHLHNGFPCRPFLNLAHPARTSTPGAMGAMFSRISCNKSHTCKTTAKACSTAPICKGPSRFNSVSVDLVRPNNRKSIQVGALQHAFAVVLQRRNAREGSAKAWHTHDNRGWHDYSSLCVLPGNAINHVFVVKFTAPKTSPATTPKKMPCPSRQPQGRSPRPKRPQ